METADETIIQTSKLKLVLLILGSCVFVALGAWMLSFDAAEIRQGRSFNFFFREPWVVYGFGVAAVVFFGLCGLYGFKKTFDKKPGLVLNSSGVVDNASGVAAGFIPWSDIAGASVYEIQGQKMLAIGLRDPRKYIDRGGGLKRTLNRMNYKMSGSPVTIPLTALEIDFAELVSLFERYQRKYGSHAGREG